MRKINHLLIICVGMLFGTLTASATCTVVDGVINVTSCGATPDDTSDDTAAIQSALTYFSGSPGKSGKIFFPAGYYKICSTLTYTGNPATGLILEGAVGGTKGAVTGARLLWTGAAGGTMLYMLALNGSTIRHLDFDGNRLNRSISPKYLLHLDATNVEGGSSGSSNIRIENCSFGDYSGTSSAGVKIGHNPTGSQVDTIIFRSCIFAGYDVTGSSFYGIDMSSSNNVKNLTLDDTSFFGMDCGVLYGGTGANSSLVVQGCTFIQDYQADIALSNPANVSIIGTRSEMCGGSSATGGYFVTGVSGTSPRGANAGVLTIQNSYWAGYVPSDGYFIRYGASLELRQNYFEELSGKVPNIQVDYPGYDAVISGPTAPGSISSSGNFYINADDANGKRVFYDYAGTSLLDPTASYAANRNPIAFISDHDWGGNAYTVGSGGG